MTENPITEQDLNPFLLHLNEWYGGDVRPFCRHIDDLIFMLLFLDLEKFNRHEVQQVGYFLKNLKDCFADVTPSSKCEGNSQHQSTEASDQ